MAAGSITIAGRPISIVLGCLLIALTYINSIPGSLVRLRSVPEPFGIEIGVLVLLLFGLACSAAIWFRHGWPRWVLLAVPCLSLFVNSYTISTLRAEVTFLQVLIGLIKNNWVYWVDLTAVVLLFLPPSSKWLGEKQDAAT